jgi:tight adherence protein B
MIAFAAAVLVGASVAIASGRMVERRQHSAASLVGTRKAQAGSSIVLGIGASAVGFGVLFVLTGSAGIALPLSLGFACLPRLILVRRAQAASRRCLEAWPDALRSIRSSLLAGRSMHVALCELVESGPQALRPVFARYARLAVTLDQSDALEAIRDESGDPYVDRIVEVLVAAVDAGPATVLDIIDDLAEAAMEDLQLRMRIETAGLEQRINAGMIMAVPIAMLLLLNTVSPVYHEFFASQLGFLVVSLGMALSLAGMVCVRRLAVLPSEPRVFFTEGSLT